MKFVVMALLATLIGALGGSWAFGSEAPAKGAVVTLKLDYDASEDENHRQMRHNVGGLGR